MSVRRYRYDRDSLADCDCEIVEDDSGGYVEYADFQKLERQLAEARAENKRLREALYGIKQAFKLNGIGCFAKTIAKIDEALKGGVE